MPKARHIEKKELQKLALFAGLTALSGTLFVVGMVQNGKGAVERYNKLIAADQAGGDVEAELKELRTYIYSHMNTEIGGENGIYPPIQLKGTYERLLAAEEARVKDVNDGLYSEAQSYCEATGNQGFSGRNRLDCINSYIDQHGTKTQTIEDSFYKYDFVAPVWSPDMAGFSLVGLLGFGLITIYYVFSYLRTRRLVKLAN